MSSACDSKDGGVVGYDGGVVKSAGGVVALGVYGLSECGG